jgi:hypothetical protein
MSVEHTRELIQLILNSVLMVLGCVLMLGRLGARYDQVETRLLILKRQCFELLDASSGRANSLIQAKQQLRQFQYRYRWLSYGMFWTNYALLMAIASTLLLSLRTLIDFEWLVVVSLVAFVVGIGLLLVAMICVVVDLHHSPRSLLTDTLELLGATRGSEVTHWRRRSLRVASSQDRLAPMRVPLKTRIG